MKISCAAVVGLGLIGGSMARALKQKLRINTVIGIDSNRQTIKDALAEDAIDMGFCEMPSELKNCDIVFLAVPLNTVVHTVKEVSVYTGNDCIITDMCSTKQEMICQIEQEMPNIRFIGGHPMAGSEKSGFHASASTLF